MEGEEGGPEACTCTTLSEHQLMGAQQSNLIILHLMKMKKRQIPGSQPPTTLKSGPSP